jgi:chemotaxis-related protein WspD
MQTSSAAAELRRGDCWNQIGVQGDGTCPELAEHVHCRNCPVYAAAARRLLDRQLPAGYEQSWARHFAESKRELSFDLETWLIFRIGAEWLALPASVIDEVASVRTVHALPHRAGVVLGVVSVRGELVVCVSLAELLGAEAGVAGEAGTRAARARLLILRRGANRFAVPVDDVHRTRRVADVELVAAPATVSRASGIFTLHVLPWENNAVGCLDAELIFQALERSLA